MKLSDLQNKTIVNLIDGKDIGKIVDVNIDNAGKITGLVVEKHRFIISRFFTNKEFEVKWNQIEKIGEDVILVRVVY